MLTSNLANKLVSYNFCAGKDRRKYESVEHHERGETMIFRYAASPGESRGNMDVLGSVFRAISMHKYELLLN